MRKPFLVLVGGFILINGACAFQKNSVEAASNVPLQNSQKVVPSQPVDPPTVVPIMIGKSREEANRIMGVAPTYTNIQEGSFLNEAKFIWQYKDKPLKDYETWIGFDMNQQRSVDQPIIKLNQLKKVRWVTCSYHGWDQENKFPTPREIVPQEVIMATPIAYYGDGNRHFRLRFHIRDIIFEVEVFSDQPQLIETQRTLNVETGEIKKTQKLNPALDWKASHLSRFKQYIDKDLEYQNYCLSKTFIHKLDITN